MHSGMAKARHDSVVLKRAIRGDNVNI